MDKVISYIEKLLLQNDYVIVPRLGGFSLWQQPAVIKEREIIPPFCTVSYNSRMNHSDGLLATELMRAENISFRQANILIEQEVEKLNIQLQQNGTINFGKLGVLYLNEEKKIAFNSSKELDFIPSNFGLKTLYIEKRKVETEKPKVVITLPRKREFIRYAAAVLILLGFFLFSPNIGDSTVQQQAGWNNILTTINHSTHFMVEENKEILQEDIVFSEEIIVEDGEFPKVYHIIVACLASIHSSEQFRDQLIARQFENAQVLPARTTNRIAINSFANREDAIDFMRNLRSSYSEFRDAWIHYEK